MTSKKKRTENCRIQLEKESEAREVRGSLLSFAKETRKGESLLKLDSLKSRTLGSSNWFVKLASWTLYGLGLLLVVVAGAAFFAACTVGPIFLAAFLWSAQHPTPVVYNPSTDYVDYTGHYIWTVVAPGYAVTLPLLYMGPIRAGRLILYSFKVVFFPKRKESWRKLVADLSLAKEKMIGFLTFMVRNFGKRGNYEGDMFDWR